MKRRDFLKKSVLVAGGAIASRTLPAQAAAPDLPASPWAVPPRVQSRVTPFDLGDVRLLDSPFRQARDRGTAYLLSLEPDRLLHSFRTEAGLEARAATYGGWESRGIAGHTLGHYLSALALNYAATGEGRVKQRVDYLVTELALCQKKQGNGYVSAIPNGKALFAGVAAGRGDAVQAGWVPWYTMHKILAGLRDAYLHTGSAPAKEALVGLSDWVIATTSALSAEQWQVMLAQEHGGMNEALADVYALTGDPKYLTVAKQFYHQAALDPLSRREDDLTGLHANTQIPKLIGLARLYELTGDQNGRTAAEFFWERVVRTRSYVIGGNSDSEHFDSPNSLADHLSPVSAETCNSYNMLKLTRHLFQWTASPEYADFYERALYNHILASQDPAQGMMTYFVSLKPGHFKTYSHPTDSFWCCVGTGMENHVKYGDSIYFHDDDSLYVNLFIPSELKWHAKGLTVTQETRFPEQDRTRLTLTCTHPVHAALKIRCPAWTRGMAVSVNGHPRAADARPGSYVSLPGPWTTGDVVDVTLPTHLHSEALADDPQKIALLYGPLVLAGQLGSDGLTPPLPYAAEQAAYIHVPDPQVPVLVPDGKPLDAWIKPVADTPLTFRTVGAGRPVDVTLKPFHTTYYSRYTVYWDTFTPEEWRKKEAEYEADQQRQRDLDARTVDELKPGEQQSERDHHLQSEKSRTGDGPGGAATHWRDAFEGGSFSFVLKVLPEAPQDLLCTFWGSDGGNRVFDVLLDGVSLGSQTLQGSHPGRYFDVAYPVPPALTTGKSQVTVRFQAHPGAMAGGLFGCRIVQHKK